MRKDWIKIKNYYLAHEISLEELSKKYKVSTSAVNKHCRLEKWVEQKNAKKQEIDKKVAERVINQEIDKKVRANEKHTELYNKGLEVAELLLNTYLEELKSGKKTKKANAYNLDFVMKAIANAQKGQRLSLRIDDSGELETNKEPEVFCIKGLDVDKI
ncbi:MAG: hypothetical protein K6E29_09350 [Cyanobacteria bacterium RUI128]|nr:hypothetical protein [Cyanobacteria bacterium RUI128]